jgi:hypothetical protein
MSDNIWKLCKWHKRAKIKRHHCCITVASLFDHCVCQKVLCHQRMHNHTSKYDHWHLKSLKMKSLASLLHHCSITVSSLFDHCFCQMVLCHQQMNNHTSNALQKEKLWSISSQNLLIILKKSNQRNHCSITFTSLFDHCLITVWSLFLSKGLVSLIKPPRHCKRIKYDIKLLKSKASLLHHCLITVWSLFLAVAPVSRSTLPRHCKRLKYDQWYLKTLTIIVKCSNCRHHCLITVFVKWSCVTSRPFPRNC